METIKKQKQGFIKYTLILLGVTIILFMGSVFGFVYDIDKDIETILMYLTNISISLLLLTIIKSRKIVYFQFVGILSFISIYAYIYHIDLQIWLPLVIAWLSVIYLPFEIKRQNKILLNFNENYELEIRNEFDSPVISYEQTMKVIKGHLVIDGDFDKLVIDNKVISKYRNYNFEFFECSLDGKKDQWMGGVFHLYEVKNEDIIIKKDDEKTINETSLIHKISQSFSYVEDYIWQQKNNELYVYFEDLTPILNYKLLGKIKPATLIKENLDKIIDIIEQ